MATKKKSTKKKPAMNPVQKGMVDLAMQMGKTPEAQQGFLFGEGIRALCDAAGWKLVGIKAGGRSMLVHIKVPETWAPLDTVVSFGEGPVWERPNSAPASRPSLTLNDALRSLGLEPVGVRVVP